MTIVVLFRCSLAVVAIRWNSSFLSGCLSFSFFLSFFVSFDYALVVSIVLPLYLREGKKSLRMRTREKMKNVFHLLLFRIRIYSFSSLLRQKGRTIEERREKRGKIKTSQCARAQTYTHRNEHREPHWRCCFLRICYCCCYSCSPFT